MSRFHVLLKGAVIKPISNVTAVVQFYEIYQTRETVFHQAIQTPRRELKIRCATEYL